MTAISQRAFRATSKYGRLPLSRSLYLASGAPGIQVTLGPTPSRDPKRLLEACRRFSPSRKPVRFIGHQSMPLGVDGYLKPSDPALASKLGALGFEHYSCHVPRGTGPLACVRWAQAMREAFDAEGMTFAVEIDWVGSGRFLSEYHEVAGFLLAVRDDWEQPFVIDCAHLHINESSGWWTPSQVDEILAADAAIEVHFSANNGRKDIHGELRPGRHPRIWEMLESINLSTVRYLVDEGRVGR